MRLTPAILKNLYASLYLCDPFIKWKLPLPEEIRFKVTDEIDALGTYLHDPSDEDYQHTITISKARCAFYTTVISTLCHEMIHLSRYRTDKWNYHDKMFRSRATMVGKELGFDHLEL